MAKTLCCLLMQVNQALIMNFRATNMFLNDIRENKILAKISGFTVASRGRSVHIPVFLSKTYTHL